MEKKIGKVILDYTFYKGEDLYTDGEIEDIILDSYINDAQNTLLYSSDEWAVLYHVSDIRENLLEWYPITKNDDVLEIGSGCGAITGLLSRKAASVTCIELSEKRSMINAYRNQHDDNIRIMLGNFQDIKLEQKFDYVTLIGVWEYSGLYISGQNPYLEMLKSVKRFLRPNGKIIIAIENKMGLKYWNGATEDHTAKLYSGINDYIGEKSVRTFSKPEIIELLAEAGINESCFYYPVADYKLPDQIFTDQIKPCPGNIRYYGKDYNAHRQYSFYDVTSFDQICHDDMFPYFSNSFLFVCGEKEERILYAKYSRERMEEYRIATYIVEQDGRRLVKKKALNRRAEEHLKQLRLNEEKWKNTIASIKYVDGFWIDKTYAVPYIEGEDLDSYFYKWRNNAAEFIDQVKKVINVYLMPEKDEMIPFKFTEQFRDVFGDQYPDNCECLKVTNLDLMFSNLKLTKSKELYNYDYEWVFDFEIPYEYVIWRSLEQLYDQYAIYLKNSITKMDFLKEFGILQCNIEKYIHMNKHFTEYVFGINDCERYLKNYKK